MKKKFFNIYNWISLINNKLDNGFNYFNKNLYFIGLMMILLNIGSKYIVKDLSKIHNRFLESPFMRAISLFVVVFIATRNVKVSIILSYSIITNFSLVSTHLVKAVQMNPCGISRMALMRLLQATQF